jgi:D-sedoheptulose 7-phosphate isomerase
MVQTEHHHMEYVAAIKQSLDELPWPAVSQLTDLLFQAWLAQATVYTMGNGGSAATAMHMAADLNKNTAVPGQPRVRAISLVENMALITALSNDLGYENVFHEQLLTLAGEGDVVIAISASGNSENVLKGVRTAQSLGATTVGITGYDGGKLAPLVDLPIVVPNHNIEQIEDLHMILEHSVTSGVRSLLQAAVRMAG